MKKTSTKFLMIMALVIFNFNLFGQTLVFSGPSRVCPGATATFTAKVIGKNALGETVDRTSCSKNFSYKVYQNGVAIFTSPQYTDYQDFVYTFPSIPSSYSITGSVLDVKSCICLCGVIMESDGFSVTTQYDLNVSSNPTIACGYSSLLTATASVPASYSWYGPSGLIFSSNSLISASNYSAIPRQTTTYTVSSTDQCGITLQKNVTVTVGPPVLTVTNNISPLTSDFSVCPNQPFTITASAPFSSNFYWIRTGSLGYEGQLFQNPLTTSITSTKKYKAYAEYTNGCPTTTKEITATIIPSSLLAPTLTQALWGASSGCPQDGGNSWIFTANSAGATSYNWKYKDWNGNFVAVTDNHTNQFILSRMGRTTWFPYVSVSASTNCVTSAETGAWANITYTGCPSARMGASLSPDLYGYVISSSAIELVNYSQYSLSATLFSIEGKLIRQSNSNLDISMNIQDVPAGIYILDIDCNGSRERKKIAINK
jgi:hypothetical protein